MTEGLPDDLEAVIGLEIHVQLSTETKMFCGCRLSFGDPPNSHTCPVCLAHPGVLPVPNEKAIEYAIRIGLALGCEIAPRSIFHRKNYFYPDNPKAYQVSQYDVPLATDGELAGIRIHRAHLEEDAAKMVHVGESGRIQGSSDSMVDFNRAGTPLVEIVTEPDLRSASEVRKWGQLLRETIRQLDVSDVNMEEGSLRCDANVSVRPRGSSELGTKTELKNMNSFRFLEKGVTAELERQVALVASGEPVAQETLHFDPATGTLHSLRSKEEAHDYRYLPEPDLVPVAPDRAMLEKVRDSLPELPEARARRYREELGVPDDPARLLSVQAEWAAFFEEMLETTPGIEPKAAATWLTGEFAGELRRQGEATLDAIPTGPAAFGSLVSMVQEKRISHGTGKELLARMVADGIDPVATVEEEGLAQLSDSSELEAVVDQVLSENPGPADEVRGGNEKAIGALIGAVMKASGGRADGGEVNRLLREKLGQD